jgi:hypothetical protein
MLQLLQLIKIFDKMQNIMAFNFLIYLIIISFFSFSINSMPILFIYLFLSNHLRFCYSASNLLRYSSAANRFFYSILPLAVILGTEVGFGVPVFFALGALFLFNN